MTNIALVGANFALKGYFPAIKKIKKFNLKILCRRNQKKKFENNLKIENNWRKIFLDKIDLIILAVPPKLQLKILKHNLYYKKDIIIEKPISNNYSNSKKIFDQIKKKKIKIDINLTYINHDLFIKVKEIIKNKSLGKVKKFDIFWDFVSQDLNKKLITWKTKEKDGGGIKNIFLTHVFSYCQFFFGKMYLKKSFIKKIKIKNLTFKNYIKCEVNNKKDVNGLIQINTKKRGNQKHWIKINFELGHIILYTKSKDWTKNFTLKIFKNNKYTIVKNKTNKDFKDGRSIQIYKMLKNFQKQKKFSNLNYCLNSEKEIAKI